MSDDERWWKICDIFFPFGRFQVSIRRIQFLSFFFESFLATFHFPFHRPPPSSRRAVWLSGFSPLPSPQPSTFFSNPIQPAPTAHHIFPSVKLLMLSSGKSQQSQHPTPSERFDVVIGRLEATADAGSTSTTLNIAFPSKTYPYSSLNPNQHQGRRIRQQMTSQRRQ